MKKSIVLFLLVCMVCLVAGCANKEDTAWTAFDPNKHKMIETSESMGYASPPPSLESFEDFMSDGASHSVILICKIARGSINRILDSDNISIGSKNNTMTEIEILEIHFQGSEVNLKVGDRIFLREPHFFITEETPQLKRIWEEFCHQYRE